MLMSSSSFSSKSHALWRSTASLCVRQVWYKRGMETSKWHGQAPSISQVDGERVFRHGHRFGCRQSDFNRRSIHPMPSEGYPHTRLRI